MKFNDIITPEIGDLSKFEPYKRYGDEKEGIIVIQFDESQLDDIREKLNLHEILAKSGGYCCYGEDNYIYELTEDSVIKRQKSDRSIQRRYLIDRHRMKNFLKIKSKHQKHLQQYSKTGSYQNGLPLFRFKSYRFVDKENGISFSYRLKPSKSKEKQPLVVLFHGAEALGSDNIRPFLDYFPQKKQLKRYDCAVLIPQAPHGINQSMGEQMYQQYLRALEKLISDTAEANNIDGNRIYLIGTSLGGSLVWSMLFQSPALFAGAVAVTGTPLTHRPNKESLDLSAVKEVPLWVAHSADDIFVPIKGDDYAVLQLQKLGAPVKYSRWEKYGHKMSLRFYKKENWAQWLFAQEKGKTPPSPTSRPPVRESNVL